MTVKEDERKLHLEMGKIIYGPVPSRRFGPSLGINPLPLNKKSCSFNCVYCQLGVTNNPIMNPMDLENYPSTDVIMRAFKDRLRRIDPSKINVITFSGNGEPTLNPELREIIRGIREILDELNLDVPIQILTNSSLFHLPMVREALKEFDYVIAKLDTVDQRCFLSLNRPIAEMNISDIIKWIKFLRGEIGERLIIQSMIIDSDRMELKNYREEVISKFLDVVEEIDPALVQLYTLDRPPSEPDVYRVPRGMLLGIASRLRARLGEERVMVYY